MSMSSKFSMAELLTATNNFSPDMILGDGALYLIYKAQLSNGLTVAIKKYDPDLFPGFRNFRAEAETLGKLRHPNIIKLLGYSASHSVSVFVYQFLERGSLHSWLHNDVSTQSFLRLPLAWETRLRIVRGVANGLAYLHGLERPIIHRDIRTRNVLLDSDFEAHIYSFGLARRVESTHSHVSTEVEGTEGYMPPEYTQGSTAATTKADVYSFGILMLETATGRQPSKPTMFGGSEMGFVEWARRMVAQNWQMKMVDQNISRERLVKIKTIEYFRIALLCTSVIPKDRPAMSEVVNMLNKIPI